MTQHEEARSWTFLVFAIFGACTFGAWYQSLSAGACFFCSSVLLALIFEKGGDA